MQSRGTSSISFEEDRLINESLNGQRSQWEPDWGIIVVLLTILQLLLSAVLDR